MGMFDHVVIPLELLPVTKENLQLLRNAEYLDWQTKSMERLLVTYTITPYREVWLLDGDWETVPEKERPYPNDDGMKGLMGSMRVVKERHEKLDYTGEIVFYGNIKRKFQNWFEFVAIFVNGTMTHIECAQQPGQFIDPEIVKTFS